MSTKTNTTNAPISPEELVTLRAEAVAEYEGSERAKKDRKAGQRKPRETKAQRQARVLGQQQAELDAEAQLPEWTEPDKTEFTLQEALEEEARLKAEAGEQDEPKAEEEEDDDLSNLARTMKKYRSSYEDAVKVHADGKSAKTKINGDPLSKLLLDREPDDVVEIAERALGMVPGTLSSKYAKLNPGQRRMNSGNRLRAAIKRGDLTVDAIMTAMHAAEAA